MSSKPKKEKQSESEKQLGVIGRAQIAFTPQFEAAHQAVLREAQADHTKYLRGRANADVMQGLAGDMGGNNVAQQDIRRQPMYEKLGMEALGSALGEATNRGITLKDAITKEGASSRLANADASGRSLAQDARQKYEEAHVKTQLANEWNNELADAGMTLASAKVMDYGNRVSENKLARERYERRNGSPQSPGEAAYLDKKFAKPKFWGGGV